MLSDDLSIVKSNLEKNLIMYTRKVINPQYNKEVEEEVKDIIRRMGFKQTEKDKLLFI